MNRVAGFTLLLTALAVVGCEPVAASAPPGSWPPSLRDAAAKVAQQATDAKRREEALDAVREPWRPGSSILGQWGVTTPRSLAVAERYAARIAAATSPEERAFHEGSRTFSIGEMATQVTVFTSRIDFEPRRGRVESREYDVLRDTGSEVEIQLRGGERERAVLSVRGRDELHVTGLSERLGGATWRRFRTPGVGLP